MLSTRQNEDVKSPLGLEESVQGPASAFPPSPKALAVSGTVTVLPAAAGAGGPIVAGVNTAKAPGPTAKGPPGVVASLMEMMPESPTVAVGATVKLAVNVPILSMVQVVLVISASTSVAPTVNEQPRAVPVEAKPPPVSLTGPYPGGADRGPAPYEEAKDIVGIVTTRKPAGSVDAELPLSGVTVIW